jgi:hypothetical protein
LLIDGHVSSTYSVLASLTRTHIRQSYPNYVPVASLPGLDHAQAMHLAIALGVEGLLQTSNASAK